MRIMKINCKILILILIINILMISSCGKPVKVAKSLPKKNSTNNNASSGNAANSNNDSTQYQKVKREKTPASPKVNTQIKNADKIIVIDPGHGKVANLEKEKLSPNSNELKIKDGGGATGIVTKTPEYIINFNIATYLKEILKQNGYKVIMTKEDVNLSLGNIDRAMVGNKEKANLVIRIHADSSDITSAEGATMLIPDNSVNTKDVIDESKRCGNIILNILIKEVNMKNRGLSPRSDMVGFNFSEVPVVLVEVGFLSNEKEDRLLSTQQYQYKIAQALADGISNCIK